MACVTTYLNKVVDKAQFQEMISTALRTLANVEFDAIAVQGNSGVSVGAVLAFLMNKHLIIVRKPNDGSHSIWPVEGETGHTKYIIVDDLIASGNTYSRIRSKMAENCLNAEFVGLFLYEGYAGDTAWVKGPIFITKPHKLIPREHVVKWQANGTS